MLFSSGWEWGYWQTDLLTLRMAHGGEEGGADWQEQIRWLWRPRGADGERLADVILSLGELQHEALIIDRLAPYLAGREAVIDFGDSIGILSQPDRPQFSEIAALNESERAALGTVVADLQRLSEQTAALLGTLDPIEEQDRWVAEVRDGIEIDALRAEFSAASYRAALSSVRGTDASADLARMDAILTEARAVVARRHADLHWGGGDRIVSQSDSNATIYQFGYLAKADSLCFWERERIQVNNLVAGARDSVPPCT